MSSLHPEGEYLLRYADGELPARQTRKIRAHLQSCWECRAELEELNQVINECVRYRKNLLAEHLPVPPARWDDLRRRFDEIDASLARASRHAASRRAMTWLPLAAALLLACGIYYQLRHTPTVQAAELLRKAMAAADTAPAQHARRLRIRTSRQTVIRAAGAKAAAGDPEIEMLRASHYNAEDPLSARSFADWREQLPDKQDQVIATAGRYRIRTSTSAGELAEATLELRTSDLHPVQERLEFRNRDWMEIEELGAAEIPPAVTASGDAPPAPRAAAPEASPVPEPFRRSAPAATVGDELQVLVALHRLGADLGDPVQVKRAGGQVLVAGAGIDPQRRQQIEEALRARQNVVVRFSDPADSGAPPARPPRADGNADSSPAAGRGAWQERIEKQAGGRANYERLAGDVLDASDSMMSRVYALRRLAEAFPPAVESEMTAADRQVLRNLYSEHAAALGQQAAALQSLLRPVLAPLEGRAASTPAPVSSGAWQDDTEDLFRTGRRVETLLAVMLGVAPGETASLSAEILSGLARLRADAEAYGPGRMEAPAR